MTIGIDIAYYFCYYEFLESVMNKLTEIMVVYAFKMDKENVKRMFSIPQEISHFISSAQIAKIIAKKRNIKESLATATALVHDIYRIKTGLNENHAILGYELVKAFLEENSEFSNEEIEKVAVAVKNHSEKDKIGNPLEELIKDVDVFDSYFYDIKKDNKFYRDRFYKVVNELSLPEGEYYY